MALSEALRKTGIEAVGDVGWGTHFCMLYHTKQDLLDILVPYFKAGLENNELCMWVTAEQLNAEDARAAMTKAVPGFSRYLQNGQILILPHTDWYLKDGTFESQRVLNGWVEKMESGLAGGFDGLRLTGDTFWLEKKDWRGFADYEAAVNNTIDGLKIMALSTYSLEKCNSIEVIDVIRNHEFALLCNEGKWELVQNTIYKQASTALAKSEEKFRGAFNNMLQVSEQRYRNLFESMDEGFALCEMVYDGAGKAVDFRYLEVNPAFARQTGLSAETVAGKTVREVIPGIESFWIETYDRIVRTGVSERIDNPVAELNKHFELYAWRTGPGQFGVVFIDVTERKGAEKALRRDEARLETLFEISNYDAGSIKELLKFALDKAISLTESRIGYIYRYNEETLEFTLNSWSPEVMQECTVPNRQTVYELDKTGIWGEAVRQRQPIVLNDFQASHPLKRGYPEGHSALHRFMTVPVIVNEKIVAVVGVANKDKDYDQSDIWQITLLMNTVWKIVLRKAAEEALRETTDYLENLFNYANAPIIVWDPEFHITRFNHAFERLTGLDSVDVIGKYLEILFPAERRDESMQHIRRTVGGERWEVVEIPILRRDGEVRTVLWNSANLYAPDGKTAIATIAQGQDITERKRSETELFKVNRELQAISACNQAMMRATDEQGLLTDVCRIICDLAGYRMAWVGIAEHDSVKSVRPVAWGGVEGGYLANVAITWGDTERGRGPTGLAARTGKTHFFQDFAIAPAAAPWREMALARGYRSSIAIPLSDATGNLLGVFTLYYGQPNTFTPAEVRLLEGLAADLAFGMTVVRERVKRKEAEEALRESEAELSATLASVPMLMLVVDPERHVLKANKAAGMFASRRDEAMLGLRAGIALRCLHSSDDPRGCGFGPSCVICKTKQSIDDTFATGNSHYQVEWHLPFEGKDEEVTFLLSTVLLPTPKKQVLLCIEDITERKRAEKDIEALNQDLRQRAVELEASNKELESFSYSVSHDLRAPLRSLDGFSQALLEDYADKLDANGKDFLNRIRQSSQLMGRLIDDMLTLSRVTRTELTLEKVNLSRIATAVAVELKQTQPQRDLEFDIRQGIEVYGDAGLLKMVMDNLLGNAWKFTSRREHARIEFGVTEANGERVCYVRDNGAGFNMQYAHKLFAPFQRLHSVAEFPGTGIGLASVQRIIHRLGGKVWAEGEPDKGATFYFSLRDNSV